MPRLIAAVVAINLLVIALALQNLHFSREQALAQVRETTGSLAILGENNILESARRIDLALLSIADLLEHQLAEKALAEGTLDRVLATFEARVPEVEGIRISDSSGVIRWGKGVDPRKPVSNADRPFYAEHKANPGHRLIVTEPIVGRVAKVWAVGFTRSFRNPDGGFAGIVSTAVPVSYLAGKLKELSFGEHGSAVLRHTSRALVARDPPVAGPGGMTGDRTVSPEFAAILDSGAAAGSFFTPRAPDGFARSYAYRRVGELPFVLTVGMSPEDYLHHWYEEVQITLALVAAFWVVSFVGTGLIHRVWQQRLAAAEALLESESRYRHYIEIAPEGVFVADAQGRYVDVNPAACTLVGYSREELLRMGISDLAPPAAAGEHEALYARIKQSEIDRIDFTLRHKDGHPVDVALRTVILPDGKVMGFCADISERKRAERELARYRSGLEELVQQRTSDLSAANARLLETQFAMDSVGIGIQWIDPESGRLIHVNRYAASLLGYSVEEMVALRVADIDPNVPLEAFARISEQVRESGFLQFETTQQTRDGRPVPVEVAAYFQAGSEHSPPRLIAFITDITRRKESERALLAAKEAAETANIAKSAFLANMSHEIRTPLNAIIGMTHLLRRSQLTPPQHERLDKIETAGHHLLEIINAVLDLSKIEAGKFALDEAEFDPAELLHNVATMVHDKATAKGLRLLIDAVSLPPRLSGDATRLQQALLNYATNAVKFTEHGQVTLHAGIAGETAEHVLLRFEVEDTGIGIADDAMERLFASFEQADNSTTRKYGGTGLGLAITRKLAELMGGSAGAVSRSGEGSRFWFTARARKPVADKPPADDGATAPDRQGATALSGRRVLLAEDEPVNREISRMLLEELGLRVDAAEDGEAALALAARGGYDLILMDMQMPKMDGLEATRRLRLLAEGAAVPVVAMTANAFEADRRACLAAGMNDFLSKPVDPEMLKAALTRWLS
jgi:PAS domain S-box-containing protein